MSSSAGDIRLGASACLLGASVRFDGGHQNDQFLLRELGAFARWVPVCPELVAGMGVPRESVRLVGPRVLGSRTGTDWTEQLTAAAVQIVDAVAAAELDGFVVKRASPSCGLERVRVYNDSGIPSRTGVGVFTKTLLEHLPELPVEEEGRLRDPVLRESFVEAVFARARWRALLASGVTRGKLVAFHTRHKYLLLAHDPTGYRELGQTVARAASFETIADLTAAYGARFAVAMKQRPTVGRHVNVLEHIAGYFRGHLDAPGRRELAEMFDDYRERLIPLSVPLALIRHHVRTFAVEYLAGQHYLRPTPRALRTRVHV